MNVSLSNRSFWLNCDPKTRTVCMLWKGKQGEMRKGQKEGKTTLPNSKRATGNLIHGCFGLHVLKLIICHLNVLLKCYIYDYHYKTKCTLSNGSLYAPSKIQTRSWVLDLAGTKAKGKNKFAALACQKHRFCIHLIRKLLYWSRQVV